MEIDKEWWEEVLKDHYTQYPYVLRVLRRKVTDGDVWKLTELVYEKTWGHKERNQTIELSVADIARLLGWSHEKARQVKKKTQPKSQDTASSESEKTLVLHWKKQMFQTSDNSMYFGKDIVWIDKDLLMSCYDEAVEYGITPLKQRPTREITSTGENTSRPTREITSTPSGENTSTNIDKDIESDKDSSSSGPEEISREDEARIFLKKINNRLDKVLCERIGWNKRTRPLLQSLLEDNVSLDWIEKLGKEYLGQSGKLIVALENREGWEEFKLTRPAKKILKAIYVGKDRDEEIDRLPGQDWLINPEGIDVGYAYEIGGSLFCAACRKYLGSFEDQPPDQCPECGIKLNGEVKHYDIVDRYDEETYLRDYPQPKLRRLKEG